MKAQAVAGEPLQQQPADTEPERIAAGEQHHRPAVSKGLLQPGKELLGTIRDEKALSEASQKKLVETLNAFAAAFTA